MKGKEFIQSHLHRYLSTVLLYCVVVNFVSTYFHFQLANLILFAFSFLWVAGVRAFDYNKKTPIPYLILGLVFLIVIAIGYWKQIQPVKLMNSYYQWLLKQRGEVFDPEIGEGVALAYTFFSILLLHIFCIPLYLITKWRKGRYIVALVGVITLVIGFLFRVEFGQITVAFFFAFCFLCLIEFSFYRKYKGTEEKEVAVTTFLTPFVIAFLILASVLPTSDSPMKFVLLKYIWSQIIECGQNVVNLVDGWINPPQDNEFNVAFAGFSEDASIGGDVISNDEIALYVMDRSGKKTCAYLIGNIKNEFLGDRWIYSVDEEKELIDYNENELDLYTLTNSILQSSYRNNINNLVHNRILEITYNEISTKTLFYIARTGYIEPIENVSEIIQTDGKLSLKKLPKQPPIYQVKALELRLGTNATTEFLTEVTQEDYQYEVMTTAELKPYINFQMRLKNLSDIDSLGEVLEKRDQMVEANYLKLPKGVSEDVKNLAYELTKDATSGYEKLKKIEEYLNTFTYTKHPQAVPEGEDFLDYFLFESKEGYCTYFATAMAIMSRCIGIPSRYVQGYCVPIHRSVHNFTATGNQAHAWMEAYFEGVGWIPFEATPSYGQYLYKSKEIYDAEKLDTTFVYEQYAQMQEDREHLQVEESEEMSVEETEDVLTTRKTYVYVLIILISILLVAIVLSVGYLFACVHHYRIAFAKAKRQEQLVVLLKRIIILFGRLQLCSKENPTLYQQFMAVRGLKEFSMFDMEDIAEYYMRLCYGDGKLSEEEETRMLEFYKVLMDYVKANFSKMKFYLLQLKLIKVKVETCM